MGEQGERDGLLAGIRVIDFGIWRPVPYATQLLSELGAEVIKVEPPDGDPMRNYPELFAELNVHKRSVFLDLKDPAGRAEALDLVADAGVVTEGFRPGVADRLGIGYEQVRAVNPSVVYCSISGYGQEGPLAAVPGHDINYQALAGIITPRGGLPPMNPLIPFADLAGGLAAAYAICAAWIGRLRTGEGERIDVSMTDVLATWTGAVDVPTMKDAGGPVQGVASYGAYETRDGRYVAIGITNEQPFWEGLCRALGFPELADLDMAARARRAAELRERIASALSAMTEREALDDLLAAGVPVSPIVDRAGMLRDPHLLERGTVIPGEDGPRMRHPVVFWNRPAS